MQISKNDEAREFEHEARLSPVCRGCGGTKDSGEGACIVCWSCWRDPTYPFKYFQGTLQEWLDGHPRPSGVIKD